MGAQAAHASKITSEMTLSEKADAIEEHMMHELDTIVTKSVFANMTDGHVEMEGGAALQKKYPGKYFNMGPAPPPRENPPQGFPTGAGPRGARRCQTGRRSWTTSRTGSPRPTICCKAA